jgi:transcriptional regulator with XRE-family HTH domain
LSSSQLSYASASGRFGAGRRAGQLDAEIGARLRSARAAVGMSLEELAARVDLSVQQLHKYEVGANRIAVSRLLELCEAIGVDFGVVLQCEKATDQSVAHSQEVVILVTRFCAISNPACRKQVLDLVNLLSGLESLKD